MVSRLDPSIARAILLTIGVCALAYSAVPPAYASDPAACAAPPPPCPCEADDAACATSAETGTLQPAALVGEGMPPGESAYEDGIPTEEISLYKTISYVTGATLTDQIWYMLIASEAATTGGVFFVVNATTSAMMTYSYEYAWAFCCEAPPGPDGVVPVSASKAIIYRGLSVIRVGGLALAFGNTILSASAVTAGITASRTAVYVANDYVWHHVDVRNPTGPLPAAVPSETPWWSPW